MSETTVLDIESPEELAVAAKAVAEYRAQAVRHVGKHARRMKLPCEQSYREQVFADHWHKANDPPTWLNHGLGTLTHLLCVEVGDDKVFGNLRLTREITPEEAACAATVIQWLGTNCGWCFLEECIRECGYQLVHEPRQS